MTSQIPHKKLGLLLLAMYWIVPWTLILSGTCVVAFSNWECRGWIAIMVLSLALPSRILIRHFLAKLIPEAFHPDLKAT